MSDRAAVLLDASALIPLVVEEHEHHGVVRAWLPSAGRIAICPIVEGAFARTLVRLGESPQTAQAVLHAIHQRPGVEFWPDALSYRDIHLDRIQGHRQLTDAYLVALATSRQAKLVTLDHGLAALHPHAVVLLGV